MLIPLLPSLLLHSEKKDQERGREGEHAGFEEEEDIWFKNRKMTKFAHCYTFLLLMFK
jgi:hypothetical protein